MLIQQQKFVAEHINPMAHRHSTKNSKTQQQAAAEW